MLAVLLSSGNLVEGPVAEPLTRFLVQIVIILVLVRILGRLLKMIRQPIVIGEIIAGVLLGPSAFGQIPGFTAAIFPKESLGILAIVANIALIFFMFFLGLEVEIGLLTRAYKSALPTAILSILIPFACGAGIAQWVATMDDNNSADLGFTLFLGTAFSFTAFPVLARILSSNRMLASPLGIQALSCAAIDDLLAWSTLALALSLAQGGSALQGLYTALIAVGFILFLVFALRPLFAWAHKRRMEKKDELNKTFVASIFLMLCVSSWFAQIIGIHAFFGAFAFGIICVPKEGILHVELAHRLELLIVEFLLPLYFCNSGLSTDITRMDSGEAWGVLAVITALACVSKILPSTLLTRLLTGIFGFGYGVKSIAQLEEDEERAAHTDGTELTSVKTVEPAQTGASHPALSASALPHSHETDLSSVAGLTTTDRPVDSHAPSINNTHASGVESQSHSPEAAVTAAAAPANHQVVRFHVGDDEGKEDSTNGVDVASGPHVSFAPSPRSSSPAVPSGGMCRRPVGWCGLKRYHPADWNLCLALGMLMNTRGLVALIVLNIGLEKGILSVKVFTMMVLMSLITTLLTPPSLYALFGREWSKQLELQEQGERVRTAQIEADKRLQEREMQDYMADRKLRLANGTNGRESASTTGPYTSKWSAELAADAALEPLISVSIAPFSASMSPESAASPRRTLAEWQALLPDAFRAGVVSRLDVSEAPHGADGPPLSPALPYPHFTPSPDGDEGISTASFWRTARSMSVDHGQHGPPLHLRALGQRRGSRAAEASEHKSQRIAEDEDQDEQEQAEEGQARGADNATTHQSPDDWMSKTAPAGTGKHNKQEQPSSR